MRYMGWPVIAVVMAVLHHSLPDVDEALGGSWWWWLLVAAITGYALWSDIRSWKKPPAAGGNGG